MRTDKEMLAAELRELQGDFRRIIDHVIGFAPTENDNFELDSFRDALKCAKGGEQQIDEMISRFCGAATDQGDDVLYFAPEPADARGGGGAPLEAPALERACTCIITPSERQEQASCPVHGPEIRRRRRAAEESAGLDAVGLDASTQGPCPTDATHRALGPKRRPRRSPHT